jgi:hypothetical protein
MVTTIVLVLVVLGLVLLALAVNSVASRIRPLRRAARRLSWRADQAKQLQTKAMALEEKIAETQRHLEETAAKAASKAATRSTTGSQRNPTRRQFRRRLD